MNERMIVRLVLRIGGFGGILYVLRHWARVYHRTGGIHFEPGAWGIWWKFLFEVCLVLIGIYLVTGAPLLVNLIAKGGKEDKDDSKK